MNNRKYPLGLFIAGIFMNLIGTWFLAVFAIIVVLVSIIFVELPIWALFLLPAVWVISAVVKQLVYRRVLLTGFQDGENKELVDRAFDRNNPDWMQTVRDDVYQKIEKHQKNNNP